LHPWIEYWLATPSNHRVHHGSQDKYINKNYGATFIIWDRIFGSYQEEEEQVIYGITKNIDHKHDPIHINFHEYYDIIRDVRSADNLKEKLFYVFGDPGDIGKYKKEKELKQQMENAAKLQHKEATIIPMDPLERSNNFNQKKPEPELQNVVGE
jgi:hypothetical protein